MTETHEPSWIWKIFGGTILAMVTILLMALFNNINENISSGKKESMLLINEIKNDIKENKQTLDSFKDRIISLENNETKSKIETLSSELKKIENDMNVRGEKVIANETSLGAVKDETKQVKDELKEIRKEIQFLREKIILPSAPNQADKPDKVD